MSTSLVYHGWGVRGYRHQRTYYEEGTIRFVIEPAKLRCPGCKRPGVVRHGYRWRPLQSLPIGRRSVWLDVQVPRIHCPHCNAFAEVHPPFADARRTYTHALARYVTDLCTVTTIKAAAEFAGLSWDIVKDIEKRRLTRQYSNIPLKGVRYIAVDEIAVRKGHRYMTLAMDLESGRVLYIANGKGADALTPFLERLRRLRTR